jgi:hypothetical protein
MRPLPLLITAIVAAGIVPSIVMLALARDLRIAKADQRPFLVAAAVEGDHRARATLREAGFRFELAVTGGQVRATMTGPLPQQPRLILQRPADAALDRVVLWGDPTTPLTFAPGRPGRWLVRLEGMVDGIPARLAESAIEIGN